VQTRDHLFKECPKWKGEQKILWAEVRKETGRWKGRWRIRDLFADRRCSQAVLDFLTMTDVGRIVPAVEEKADAESEVSEWELRECQRREEERRKEAEALGTGRNHRCSYPPHPSWHCRGRSRGGRVFFLCRFFCHSPWCALISSGTGRRALGELAKSRLARTADRKTGLKCTPP